MQKKEDEKNNDQEVDDEFYIKRVAHFIKSKRKTLKLTQEQMAKKFKIDENQIWRMENGKTSTKLSTSIKVIKEFAEMSEMPSPQFIAYLLKIPSNKEDTNLGPNEISILKAFRSVPAELRREYAELAKSSDVKFSLALAIQKYPTPIIKKILELLKTIFEK